MDRRRVKLRGDTRYDRDRPKISGKECVQLLAFSALFYGNGAEHLAQLYANVFKIYETELVR